jgi:exodeoxyribonuclease VIII
MMETLIRPNIKPGVCHMPAAQYHAGPGISKSNLDWIHECPALLEWARNAPVDDEAKSAVQIGTAFHTLLLEPARFALEYVADFKPPVGALDTAEDLRGALDKAEIPYNKSATKGQLTKLLLDADPNAPVSDVMQAEWKKGIAGRIVVSAAEWRKLHLMRDSVMAHPTARKLIELPGEVEQCHFWRDKETGELCRSRPDKTIDSLEVISDVKTAADVTERGFNQSIHEYRYHVQDAYYTDGCAQTLWKPRKFLFLLVGTTRDRARYPVHVREISKEHAQLGRDDYRLDLHTYSHAKRTGVWNGIETASLPDWFVAQRG